MSTTTIASWLLTYLIHSTVLLSVAWLVSRMLNEQQLALQEIFLRLALIGGILTSSLQVGLGVVPLAGEFAIDVVEQPQSAFTTSTDLNGLTTLPGVPDLTSASGFTIGKSTIESWAGALLTLWGAGSLLVLLALGRSALDLRRLLQTRQFRPAGRLVERLATAMGLGRRVLLSTSKAIAVPFATGIRKLEICCPERICDLAIEHQTGLFAHELAHLARRDPAWQLLYRLGEAILFLQPLNRLVRRRLEEIAEHLTDERAVICTGDRLGLARCLVVIAHWGTSSRLGVPAAALASGPRLDRRVRRLLNDRMAEKVAPIWATPLVVCLVAAAALTLPAVASVPSDVPITVIGSDAASTKTWSAAEDAPAGTPPAQDQPSPPNAVASAPPPLAPASEPAHASPAVPVPEAAPANGAPSAAPSTPAPAEAPAPLAAPAPAVTPSKPAPSAVSSRPAPAKEPAPAVAPAPRNDVTPPSPRAAPAPPGEPDEPNGNQETKSTFERGRERPRQENENRQRRAEKEQARAETHAKERARQLEERARAHEERARHRAVVAKGRSRRFAEERREEFRSQVDEMRALAEERAREWKRAAEQRARVSAERAQQLAVRAAERAERSALQRDELRRQVRELNRKAIEDARRFSEEARRLAEEAERKAHAEQREKNE